jgi:vacuolar-type H+-ATPase subunit I/STV1
MVTGIFMISCGAFIAVASLWAAWRLGHRGRPSSRFGWGGFLFGLGLILHGVAYLTANRQPLGVVLALCSATATVTGTVLLVRFRPAIHLRRKRAKLPPLNT